MVSGEFFKECLFCGRSDCGREGIVLRGRFICGCCELDLVSSGCDSLLYGYYVNGLKKMWRCTGA